MKKVVKFGGSSLANAEQFKKVGEIIRSEESRRYVVPVSYTHRDVYKRQGLHHRLYPFFPRSPATVLPICSLSKAVHHIQSNAVCGNA